MPLIIYPHQNFRQISKQFLYWIFYRDFYKSHFLHRPKYDLPEKWDLLSKSENMTVKTTFKFGEIFGEGKLLAALRYLHVHFCLINLIFLVKHILAYAGNEIDKKKSL